MKSFFTGILIVGLALSPLSGWSEPVQSLNIDQAIDLALTNSPQLQAARAQLGVSEAAIVTAGARLNPSLMSDNGIAEKTYRFGVEQTIELGGKRRQRVSLAQAQRDVMLSEINTRILDLRNDVRRAYTQLYNAQERQRNSENILQVSQELVTIAQKREKAGDIAQLDVLQTDIVRVNAQNDLQSVTADVLNARTRLNALLNQPVNTVLTLAPPNTSPQLALPQVTPPATPQTGPVLQGSVNQLDADLDSLIQEALNRRPEMQQITRNIEVTQRQLRLARVNRIPNLSLAAGPDIVTGDEGEFNAFFIANVEIPLFNRQQGPIREALARRAQLEQEQAALKNRIASEVTTAYTSFQMNQARIQRYETQLLPMSVAVVDKSRRAFQEGKTSILTPIQAQQAYINTRLGYLQALQDYQNAISDLERAVGTGL